jgi:hypothetical protein
VASDETLRALLGEQLWTDVLQTCSAPGTSPEQYLRAAVRWCLQNGPDPAALEAGGGDPCVQETFRSRELILGELIQQGAYLAARLDGIELAARGLLNLELQTDKRDQIAVFSAIHRALQDELHRRDLAL